MAKINPFVLAIAIGEIIIVALIAFASALYLSPRQNRSLLGVVLTILAGGVIFLAFLLINMRQFSKLLAK